MVHKTFQSVSLARMVSFATEEVSILTLEDVLLDSTALIQLIPTYRKDAQLDITAVKEAKLHFNVQLDIINLIHTVILVLSALKGSIALKLIHHLHWYAQLVNIVR